MPANRSRDPGGFPAPRSPAAWDSTHRRGGWRRQAPLDHAAPRPIDRGDLDLFPCWHLTSTFFGDSDSTRAATADEFVYFDDFVISTQPIAH